MRINFKESIYVSLNAAVLAIVYTVFGALISFIFYHLFDEANDDWKKRSLLFQVSDVTFEIIVIAVMAFWSAQLIEISPPVFPVRKELDLLVDGYISGIFFIFAIFLFLDDLTAKLKYLYETLLGKHFTKLMPQHGSIVDLSLSYEPLSKTDIEN
jgi:hypothetical protein